MSSPYQASFFVVPSRILNLSGLVLNYLKIYETVFQFWNHGKTCFLSNQAIMERTNVKSESTIREALAFFEKHNELIRRSIDGKRYLIQPERVIIDPEDVRDNPSTPAAKSTPPHRQVDAPPAAKSTHNNKKINIKKINKDREAIPAEFSPNENHFSLACSLNVDVVAERDKFFDWATANGKKMADWNAAFRNWIRKAAEFRKSAKVVPMDKNESALNIMRRLSQSQGWN